MAKRNYEPVNLGSFVDGSEEWLGVREHGKGYMDINSPDYIPVVIGGSAVGTVLGDSNFESPLELWAKKSKAMEIKIPRPMNKALLEAGHIFEPFVVQMFERYMKENMEVKNLKIWNDTNMYQHPHYPFAVGNLDRRMELNGKQGILECKTTSNFDAIKKWKDGIVPKSYEWQCRYYMAIMNLDYCYIFCCWGFTLKDMAVVLIERDKQIEETMMKAVEDFVDCCVFGVMPTSNQSDLKLLNDFYIRLYGDYPDENAPAVELPDTEEIYDLMEQARTLNERKQKVQAQLDALKEEEAKVCSEVLKYAGGKASYATYRLNDDEVIAIKLKLPYKRAAFDEERFKTENPAMYSDYLKTETKEKFDITKFKKEHKKEASEYMLPPAYDPTKTVEIKEISIKQISV